MQIANAKMQKCQNAKIAKMQKMQNSKDVKCEMHIMQNAKCSLLATLPSTLRTAHWLSVAQIEGGSA